MGTYILVPWNILVETGKLSITVTWEPQSELRARWGGKQADQAIYEAAREAGKHDEEAVTGDPSALDRAPLVGLNNRLTHRMREQLHGVGLLAV